MGCCFSTTTPPNTATEQNVLATARERYTTPHAIWEALSTDHVKLLRASYLVKLAREGRVLCRRQELPPDAFIDVEELKSLYGDGNRDGVLPVLSVSFCWDTPPHPDPSGKQVATVAAALEREMPEYAKMGFTEMGIFWDWAALYQKDPALFDSTKTPEAKPEGPERDAFLEDLKEKRAFYGGEAYEQSRTPDQKEAFGRALHNTMDLWYAHQGTTVYLLTHLPKSTRRKLGYDDSGWTTYERRSAEQIKKVFLYEANWKLVRDLGSDDFDTDGAGSRNWPLDPDGFDELIESKQFTNGADKGTVKTLYRKMSKAQLSGIEMLDFTGISAPSVRDMEQLGRCLNLCENLKMCNLSNVGLADDACRALFSTLKVNAVLTSLNLRSNQLCGLDRSGRGTYSPAGITALAEALKVNGVLTTLNLRSNRIGDEGAVALGEALRGNGVLTTIDLSRNDIRREGGVAIGNALAVNEVLTNLDLSSNNIGGETCWIEASEVEGESKEVGATVIYQGREMVVSEGVDSDGELRLSDVTGVLAIADALKVNGVLTNLNLRGNSIGAEGAKAIGEALAINAVLKSLDVRCNEISGDAAQPLATAVLASPSLEIFGSVPLKELRANTLDELDLSDRDLGVPEALVLAKLVEGSGVLKSIDLSDNNLGDEGEKAIHDAVSGREGFELEM